MRNNHSRFFYIYLQEQDALPLNPTQKDELQAHLAACPTCRAELRMYQELRRQADRRWSALFSPLRLEALQRRVDRRLRLQRISTLLRSATWVGLAVLLVFLGRSFVDYLPPVPARHTPAVLTFGTPEYEIITFTTLSQEIEFGHLGGALDMQGDVLVAGAPHWQRPPGQGAGAAYVYRQDAGGNWQPETELTGDLQPEDENEGPENEQHFGEGVAVWGSQIAVGAPGYDGPGGVENSGAVYIFDFNGSAWARTALLTSSQPISEGKLGSSVVLYGDYLAVSGYPEAGEVLVFKHESGAWRETARLPVPTYEDGSRPYVLIDLFGDTLAVSIYRRTFLEGDVDEDTFRKSLVGSGTVTLYRRSGEEWLLEYQSPEQKAAPFYIYEGPFGIPVALGGEEGQAAWLAVGRPGFPGSGIETGSVAIFEREAQGWAPIVELRLEEGIPVNGALPFFYPTMERASGDLGADLFGASVVANEERLAVISTFANTAYIFERQASDWAYRYRIIPLDGPDGLVGDDFQRRRVALEGDTFMLGNPGELGGGFICVFDLKP